MRDVFKRFQIRKSRSVQQDVLIETQLLKDHVCFRELGYEYRSRGVWLDPRTGKRVNHEQENENSCSGNSVQGN